MSEHIGFIELGHVGRRLIDAGYKLTVFGISQGLGAEHTLRRSVS